MLVQIGKLNIYILSERVKSPRLVCLVFFHKKKYNKANGQSCANRKRKKVDFMANILVVEDEKSMQEIIVEYMQRGGHT